MTTARTVQDWAGRATGLPRGPRIREVDCRAALSKSGLRELVYALNPYVGCQHGCSYCYAPGVIHEERPWGTFVDVRRNMPTVLAREVRELPPGLVGLGTVTDAYQQVEERLQVTRRCLEVLGRAGWPVSVQTKSHLVVRDIDLLARFEKKDVGMTVTSTDDLLRRQYEPSGSVFKDKLLALSHLHEAGIPTWVYIGPLLPGFTDAGLAPEGLVAALAAAGVGKIYVDRLRYHPGVWEAFGPFLRAAHPQLFPLYDRLRAGDDRAFRDLAGRFGAAAERLGLACQIDF